VYLACKHPNLVWQYSQSLAKLGIPSRVMLQDWRVLIQGQKPVAAFAAQVGFLPGVTVSANSRYWQGSPKSEVLRLLLDSYGNPQPIYDLPMFSE
jgi:hypothetical protein